MLLFGYIIELIGFIYHEDGEKENRSKVGQKENENLINKINELMEDLKRLKKEIEILKKVVNERQSSLLDKIRISIDQAVNEILSNFNYKEMEYFDLYNNNTSNNDMST